MTLGFPIMKSVLIGLVIFAVIAGCGENATSMFESRSGSGASHSDKARDLFPNYYIGGLAIQ